MTKLGLIVRLAATWLSVAWFAFFVLDVLGHYDVAGRILRAAVAGFFVALSTAPAYYWRFKAKPVDAGRELDHRLTSRPDRHETL